MDVFSYLLGKKTSSGGGSPSEYFSNEIGVLGAGSIVKKLPDNIILSSEATELNGFFYGWENITTIPLLDTSNATDMSWMFEECTSLKNIPNINTINVKKFQGMFYECINLEDVPELNGSSVIGSSSELLQQMFYDCTKLTNNSLKNILKFLKTCTNYTGTKELSFIGLNRTQANYCTTLSEWTELSATGWTTGF